MDLLAALKSGASVFAAELRPPRAELAAAEGMDAWIDTYHAYADRAHPSGFHATIAAPTRGRSTR